MGRWGDGIYDNDKTLDFFSTLTDKLEREIAFWMPHQTFKTTEMNGEWLAQVFCVIEIMLLFEQHEKGDTVYLRGTKRIQRWRKIFMHVWDTDWNDSENPRSYNDFNYGESIYRKKHRPAVVSMFDRLYRIAYEWENEILQEDSNLPPLHSEYPLPHFSIQKSPIEGGEEIIRVKRFTMDFIEYFVQLIIYWLSEEKRSDALIFDDAEVWVAVDLLGLLCEKYQQSPMINVAHAKRWRQATIEISIGFEGMDVNEDVPEDKVLFPDIITAFDKLEELARKYPRFEL